MKKFQINLFEEKFTCFFEIGEYHDRSTAVQIKTISGEPFCAVSVWFKNSKNLPDGNFYLRNWSENTPIIDQLIRQNLIEKVEGFDTIHSGFVSSDVYRLVE